MQKRKLTVNSGKLSKPFTFIKNETKHLTTKLEVICPSKWCITQGVPVPWGGGKYGTTYMVQGTFLEKQHSHTIIFRGKKIN